MVSCRSALNRMAYHAATKINKDEASIEQPEFPKGQILIILNFMAELPIDINRSRRWPKELWQVKARVSHFI